MIMVLSHLTFTTFHDNNDIHKKKLTTSTSDDLAMQSIENHISFSNYNAQYGILLLTFYKR